MPDPRSGGFQPSSAVKPAQVRLGAVKVSVTRQGGFLDLDQRVEIDDEQVLVTESGVARKVIPPDDASAKRVSALARVVADLPKDGAPSVDPDTPLYDEMVTEIAIEEAAGTVHRLAVVSGADVPPAVWELISAVDRCAGG